MAEKVIFEFRARCDEDSHGVEVRHGHGCFAVFGLDMWPCCPPEGVPRGPHAGRPKGSHPGRDKARHHVRETLDFFERMYDDLFGQGESDKGQ
jgi:hypothetical protein